MLANARQRQLRRQQRHFAARSANPHARITRQLFEAIGSRGRGFEGGGHHLARQAHQLSEPTARAHQAAPTAGRSRQ
jgi:hypothetical protein